MRGTSSIHLAGALIIALAAAGCSSSSDGTTQPDAAGDAGADGVSPDGTATDAKPDGAEPDQACAGPAAPVPGPCDKDEMEALKGQYQLVLDSLEIGGSGDGFDLDNADCDDDPLTGTDNILWPLGALAKQSVDESMESGDIVVPIELFGVDDVTNDACLNFALYYGAFAPDRDGDGAKAGGPLAKPEKDCNDHDAAISHTATEVAGNGVDDNCNGVADEDGAGAPSTDGTDADGDGQSIADGDCDDRKDLGAVAKKGAAEICGDGFDNDCNGFADDGCLPWTDGMSYPIDGSSVDENGEGVLAFRSATIKDGMLDAGPARFAISLKIDKDASLDLNLSHVFVRGKLSKEGDGLKLTDGQLGGVLSARAMDQVPNLVASLGGGGSEDDSLLDAVIGMIGMLLALPTDAEGNRLPDIDVDGDGLEKFIDTDADGDTVNARVDTCIDGDGTEVKDKVDASGKVVEPCTLAKDAQGNFRFVDGWSIALKLSAVPTILDGITK